MGEQVEPQPDDKPTEQLDTAQIVGNQVGQSEDVVERYFDGDKDKYRAACSSNYYEAAIALMDYMKDPHPDEQHSEEFHSFIPRVKPPTESEIIVYWLPYDGAIVIRQVVPGKDGGVTVSVSRLSETEARTSTAGVSIEEITAYLDAPIIALGDDAYRRRDIVGEHRTYKRRDSDNPISQALSKVTASVVTATEEASLEDPRKVLQDIYTFDEDPIKALEQAPYTPWQDPIAD